MNFEGVPTSLPSPSHSHHAVLLQRFKLLDLVHEVAKADIAELIRTVGLEALTYKGSGIRGNANEEGKGSQPPRNTYIDRKGYHNHIYRNFNSAQPQGTEDQARAHRVQRPLSNEKAAYLDAMAQPKRKKPVQPAVPPQPRSEHDERQGLVTTPERERPAAPRHHSLDHSPKADNTTNLLPPNRHPPTAASALAPVDASPHREVPIDSPAKIPLEVIQMAAKLLAREKGKKGSRDASVSQSLNVSAAIDSFPVEVTVDQDSPSGASKKHSRAEPATTGNTMPNTSASMPRHDASQGSAEHDALPQQRSTRDSAVEMSVDHNDAETMTPPPSEREGTAPNRQHSTHRFPRHHVHGNNNALGLQAIRRDSKRKGGDRKESSHREDDNDDDDGEESSLHAGRPSSLMVASGPPSWALEAAKALDSMLHEQERVSNRLSGVKLALNQDSNQQEKQQAVKQGPTAFDDSHDNDFLSIYRTARSVDKMIDAEEAIVARSHGDDVPVKQFKQKRRGNGGRIQPVVLERIREFQKEERECIRYNELLWNTSNVSQHVFADRLTAALLDDLLAEVVDEVHEVLDDYVEGLAEYELQ